jgi:hypothetical protein
VRRTHVLLALSETFQRDPDALHSLLVSIVCAPQNLASDCSSTALLAREANPTGVRRDGVMQRGRSVRHTKAGEAAAPCAEKVRYCNRHNAVFGDGHKHRVSRPTAPTSNSQASQWQHGIRMRAHNLW